jgi:hypothetical protein
MLFSTTLSSSRPAIASASLPLLQPSTLDGDHEPAAARRVAGLCLSKHETRKVFSAIESRQGDHSYRSLYVLGVSLALATLAMIAVALAF